MTEKEKSPEEVQKLVEELREWVKSKPELPQDLEDRLLKRFIHSCYYDIEKAKKALQLFFSVRESAPEIFANRDPLSEEYQKIFKYIFQIQLPASENKKLWIWQINDPGLNNFEAIMDARLFGLATDVWLLSDESLPDGDIFIANLKDVSFKFFTKFSLHLSRIMGKYQQEALPVRIVGAHIINAPWFINKMFAIMRPFMKQHIQDMIHVHSDPSTILNYLKKEELPDDFGGTCGTMEELMKETIKKIVQYRDIIVEDKFLKTNNTKKTDEKTSPEKVTPDIAEEAVPK